MNFNPTWPSFYPLFSRHSTQEMREVEDASYLVGTSPRCRRSLRHSRFMGLRGDKKARDVSDESDVAGVSLAA